MAARFSGATRYDLFELGAGRLVVAGVVERAAERDFGRQITGMALQTEPAEIDRLLVMPCPSVFLGKWGKRDRRRVEFDPASQLFDPGSVGHRHFVATVPVVVAFLPVSSVTVSVTT